SVEELIRALERKGATLPAEIAAFIAFSACESMIEQGPRELTLSQLRVNEHGNVVLHGAPCEEAPGARSLHRALVALLAASGKNLAPALAQLRDEPAETLRSLRDLHDRLEATLVPLNRTASRRVLARFARDAAYPLIEPRDVDAALNSMLADEAPANDAPERARSVEPEARLHVDLLEGLDLEGDDARYLETSVGAASRLSGLEETRALPSTRPSMAPSKPSLRSQAAQLEELGSPSSSRKLFIGFALFALAVLVVIAAVSLRDGQAREELLKAEEAAAIAELKKPPAVEAGDLVVHVSEPNAQVLRLVGRAPVSIEKLPVGIAHEFVATAEGYKPARALVPANGEWEATAEGARYELAIQLVEAGSAAGEQPKPGDGALDLGPSRLTSQGTAQGTGSVRVITTPRGARVFQLVGFSPLVKVENLPLEAPQELLIYREGFSPVLRVLSPQDFVSKGGKRVAEIDVALTKTKRQ
ncbi:MAG TPA: hypothetical protein VI299_02200, partial [Polyangiales bacterium]